MYVDDAIFLIIDRDQVSCRFFRIREFESDRTFPFTGSQINLVGGEGVEPTEPNRGSCFVISANLQLLLVYIYLRMGFPMVDDGIHGRHSNDFVGAQCSQWKGMCVIKEKPPYPLPYKIDFFGRRLTVNGNSH